MSGILTPKDPAGTSVNSQAYLLPGFVSCCWSGLFELPVFLQLENNILDNLGQCLHFTSDINQSKKRGVTYSGCGRTETAF